METDSPSPAKKQRPANLKVVECIREFKLPQTYPSMIRFPGQTSANTTIKAGVRVITVPHEGKQVTNKVQKLKLKSPDGRDLGEFNVQMLPKDNGENNVTRKILTQSDVNQQNAFKSILKSPTTVLPMNGNNSRATSIVKYVNASNLSTTTNDSEQLTPILIPITSGSNLNYKNDQTSSDSSEHQVFVVQTGDNWRLINMDDKAPKEIQLLNTMESNTAAVNFDVCNQSNDVINSVKPKTSALSSVRLLNPGKGIKRSQANVNDNEKNVVNVGRSSLMQKNNKFEKINGNGLNKSDAGDVSPSLSVNEVLQDGKNDNEKSLRKTVTLRNSHGRVNLIRRGQREGSGTILSSRNSNRSNSPIVGDSTKKSSSSDENCRNSFDNDEFTDVTSTVDSNIANNVNIIANALEKLDDIEMRNKALKALAACGLGFERLIPKKPPLDEMSVRETSSQTNVFGILDPIDFVRVTGDTDSLVRLQEIERQIIVDDTKITKKPSPDLTEFSNKLNDMLDSGWVNKANVDQVKELLKVDPLVEKAFNLLERDFENCKLYDKNGLLNIHRAVMKDQERTVQRLIMVLRSRKESIDVPTEDGRTSLELAIYHFASPVIVNLLLKAGASPTSQLQSHDSALTIAGKESSPYLLQLIKYVSSSGALNNVDSEGFTCLHYCVINDNMKGVVELIRANADVNVRDRKSGRTPLFHALEKELLPITRELLANGAKGNIPNFGGQTVLALYDEEKHYTLKDALTKSLK